MVDSRAKGARGEYLVRDMLREATGLKFERVPASGALEYLKGDIYVPNNKNLYCIEVKNYADSPLTDKIFTDKKPPRVDLDQPSRFSVPENPRSNGFEFWKSTRSSFRSFLGFPRKGLKL